MKSRKHKFLSLLLTLCMVFSLMPAMAFADEVATTVSSFDELQTALSQGGEIIIGADINFSSKMVINRSATIDLNGKTLTYTGSSNRTAIHVNAAANITIKDNSGDGELAVVGSTDSAILNAGTLTILSGTISNDTGTAIDNRENLIIYGGTISATTGKAINTYNTGTVNISSGTITSATSNYGTISVWSGPTTINISDDASVTNTAEDGYTVYFDQWSGVTADNIGDYYSNTSTGTAGKVFPANYLSFDARNGEEIAPVIIANNMILLTNPTWGDNEAKDNYEFAGWYDDIDGQGKNIADKDGNLIEGNTPSTNTTLFAKWTKNDKTVLTEQLHLTQSDDINSDYGYKWENNNGTMTLTLDNCTVNTKDENAILIEHTDDETMPVKIILQDDTDNTVISTFTGNSNEDSNSVGIMCTLGELTISGDATLTVKAGNVSKGSSGGIICDGNITLEDCTINAYAGTSRDQSCAIMANDINITNSTVNAYADISDTFSYSIVSLANINITNASNVYATGNYIAILASNEISVDGLTITGSAEYNQTTSLTTAYINSEFYSDWHIYDSIYMGAEDTDTFAKTVKIAPSTPVTPSTPSSSSSTSSNTITTVSTTGGSANVSVSKANVGDTVTVSVSAKDGYVVDSVIVKDTNGKIIEVTKLADGIYTFIKPIGQVKVEPVFKEIAQTSTSKYSDMKTNAWYYDTMLDGVERGIISGTSETTLSPESTTTRAMVWTMLGKLENANFASGATWYAGAQQWAKANNVSDGSNPENLITREQLVTMLYRYAVANGKDVSVGENTNILSYDDSFAVSDYAKEAMQWGVGSGIIKGNGDNTLNAQGTASRAETVAMVIRYMDLMK